MVANPDRGVDLEHLTELYRRGESEFFREIVQQFPAIREEIMACREMVAQVALRMSEVRDLEYGAFGRESHIGFLENERDRLAKNLEEKERREKPMCYGDWNEDGEFITPFAKAMKQRQ